MSVLLKSIHYFGSKRVFVQKEDNVLKQQVLKEFHLLNFDNRPYDIIYFNNNDPQYAAKYLLNPEFRNNNTLLLVDNIHQNKASSDAWKSLKEDNSVTVTMDLFYCGVVFFRTQQVKEHFRIRI